ncbi:uncharacterized protein LOC129988245 isoform X2 [Argiope bruennichi]|uniref:uncharacterized protein LOC129988245 isoform X2 n=1 Tax=Argiope bruennichi TaxID=94029 RepID=UPI002493EA4B|nr:uncharacterized protein LOC129988245 isoform X2 [Argiope bruennichi]
MSKSAYAKCSDFLKTVFLILFIHFCTSAPVTENAYMQFIAELNRNKCSVPSQVQLPFDTTKVNNFEYLSTYLEICQMTELAKRNKEAVVLCKEIFDNIRSISCPTKIALPDINVKLSENVCKDINAKKDSIPEDDKSLLKRLTDGFLCDIMCDSEFEKACQVLLWSFEVQKLIASVANAQEPEQPNAQENEGDANGVANVQEPEQPNAQENGGDINDNFRQDNAVDDVNPLQVSIASENGKKSTKEAKDVNGVIESNGVIGVSEPHILEDNPEQKLGVKVISDKNGKQEKLVSKDKEVILGNQTLPKAEIPDGASKSTNNFKTSNTLFHQISVVQTSNSDAETEPMSETTKVGSDVQDINKQVQSNVVNMLVAQQDEVNTGNVLSQGPATNVAIDEESQDINVNIVHKDTNIKEHPQDNSNVLAKENVSLNDGNVPNTEILDQTAQKDQNSKFFKNNELPHESGNEKKPNNAATSLHNDGQIASDVVNTLAQNKFQSTSSGADKFAEETGVPSTDRQTIKDTTQQKLVHVAIQNKTGIARNGSKTDQTQINSGLKKVEVQDHINTDKYAPGLITDDGTKNTLKDQQKTKVAQQTEETDNAIPSSTGTAIAADEKHPENGQKSKATVINPDSKSVPPNSLTETLTKSTVALEKMEGGSDLRQPADEEADHFEDLENTEDEEYSRPEYDGGLYEVSKNKESNPNVPSPITIDKEIITSQNERPIEFPSRNSFGQDTNDIQMIAAFPEQEDSHFFFYFLSIVLILMAGYLIFHNKQKIIALIVEGRHERNRRSHRIGYKKLETK